MDEPIYTLKVTRKQLDDITEGLVLLALKRRTYGNSPLEPHPGYLCAIGNCILSPEGCPWAPCARIRLEATWDAGT